MNFAAILAEIQSESAIPLFTGERMFYQLESPNAREGCDNSRLPRVQLSVGVKEMDLKSYFNPKSEITSAGGVNASMEQKKGDIFGSRLIDAFGYGGRCVPICKQYSVLVG